MDFKTEFGLPLVDSENFIPVFESLGIKKWRKLEEMSLETYLAGQLTSEETANVARFSPQTAVKKFLNPKEEQFIGFSQVGGDEDGVLVFTILPGNFVPIIAEFKHGAEEVVIALPGGKINAGETPELCGQREFLEEIGIELEKTELLNLSGTPVAPRTSFSRGYFVMGYPKYPIIKKPSHLDQNEFLQAALIGTDELRKLIWNYHPWLDPFSALLSLVALVSGFRKNKPKPVLLKDA